MQHTKDGVLGTWGEWLFIFREPGSTGNYFQGLGEQVHNLRDLGSPETKSKKKSHLKGKAFISFRGGGGGGGGGGLPDPHQKILSYLLSC